MQATLFLHPSFWDPRPIGAGIHQGSGLDFGSDADTDATESIHHYRPHPGPFPASQASPIRPPGRSLGPHNGPPSSHIDPCIAQSRRPREEPRERGLARCVRAGGIDTGTV